ncbi:MAG: hypothetical protein EOO05_15625 [Chitinophagaceae bacterium]|nr:MAG: hypothetical protein EOO05_15625 [Chitinophagaceae bacterium]
MSLKILSCTLLSLALLFSSCQQEPDEELDPQPPAATGNLKATVGGVAWAADRAEVSYRVAGLISISGLSINGRLLTMTLVDSGVHRYTLNATVVNGAAWVDSTLADRNAFTSNQSDDVSIAGGEVNITSINESRKTMSGTFTYNLYRMLDDKQLAVTNGSFTDLPYFTELPATPGSDTIRLKVDGVSFVPDVNYGLSVDMLQQLNISGTTTTGNRSIGISMPQNILAGSYQFEGLAGTSIGVYNPDLDGTNARYSESGTLVILEHNTGTKRLRGTFQFHGTNLLDATKVSEITEGYFSVKYQ